MLRRLAATHALCLILIALPSGIATAGQAQGCDLGKVASVARFSSSLIDRLKEFRKSWLIQNAVPRSEWPPGLPQGWEVVAKIGKGTEAMVYLIRSADGTLRTFKSFHQKVTAADFLENFQSLTEYGERGVPIAKVLHSDAVHKTLTQEYVDGFSVHALLWERDTPGFSDADRTEIRLAYRDFLDEVKKRVPDAPLIPVNVVFDPESGRFVLIDPH